MKLKSNLEAKPPKIISDLRDLVRSSKETFGDKIVYSYVEKGEVRNFTYTDLWEDMNRLGTALARRSFKGRRIAVIGELHPGWVTTYLAAVNGGNVIVPLDKDIDDDHMPQFMELAEVSAVFYTSGSASKIEGLRDRLPRVELFVPINPPDGFSGDDRTVPYNTLLEEGEKALEEGCTDFTEHEIDMEIMCTLLFTSGTTGTSKGVMLSQRNLTAAINSSCLSMAYDDRNTFVSVLPPHHTYEMTCTNLSMINIGAWVFINDSLKHVVRNFSNFKPNTLILVPLFVETMYKKIWDQIEKKGLKKKVRLAMAASDAMLKVGVDRRSKLFSQILDAFGGNIRSIVCGGAPLSPKLVRDFYSFGIIILEGYGITECSPLVAVNSPDNIKLRSVGQAVNGVEIRIDKTDDEDTGEILVKGDNVMLGYYNDPEGTAAVFTEDGFFRTGDIGYMDSDGFLFITGRKKNVIILSNGKNVFPEEIEERLTDVETISESVVVGRKNDNGDIVITAIVVPEAEFAEGKSDDEILEEIKKQVNEINLGLPSFKQIHDVELRHEEFEKNSSRKIKRYMIK